MWNVAITAGSSEFEVAKTLRIMGLEVVLPYVRTRVRIKLRVPKTRSNPNPRDTFKAEDRDEVRWPRYVFVDTDDIGAVLKTKNVRGMVSFGGEVASVSDKVINSLKKNCDATGCILKMSSLYEVGDILSFIVPSPMAGRSGEVLRLDDVGVVLSVDGHSVSTSYGEVSKS